MQVITSHLNLDFDGLAAMVAAQKIYPEAQIVIPGKMHRSVQDFLALYKDTLEIKKMKDIDIDKIDSLVVVDTASSKRIGELGAAALRKDMPLVVFDHHPPGDLSAECGRVEKVGAVTTLFVEELQSRAIPLTAFEATIMALGIYSDTGNLLYSGTTEKDAGAVSFLLSKGANLEVVRRFSHTPFNAQQQKLFEELLESTVEKEIRGTTILIAKGLTKEFIPGLGEVTEKLADVTNAPAIFSVVSMGSRVQIVGRSRRETVRVNEILAQFGGGGHTRAAAAAVKEGQLEETLKKLLELLSSHVLPGLFAADIMSSPVKTINAETSIAETQKLLLRYGHTGIPVLRDGRLAGIISRRDIDKAFQHGLAHAPVKGFMSGRVVAAAADLTVKEVQELMIRHDIGRVPVIDRGKLAGIISRSDILRTLHGENVPRVFRTFYQKQCRLACPLDTEKQLINRTKKEIIDLFRTAGKVADDLRYKIYVVGGFVRDMFLNISNEDIDFVIEGDGLHFAEEFAAAIKAETKCNQRFSTAKVYWREIVIDIATARREYYAFPAALPEVENANIRADLYRRDFTMNAMAVQLNAGDFGSLVDFFCGYADLEQGIIRILYSMSFVEDPTRILRAIRFEAKYGFHMDEETEKMARDALTGNYLEQVSAERKWHELKLILNEKNLLQAAARLADIKAWQQLLPGFMGGKVLGRLKSCKKLLNSWENIVHFKEPEMLCLGILLSDTRHYQYCFDYYNWPLLWQKRWKDAFILAGKIVDWQENTADDLGLWHRRLSDFDNSTILMALAINYVDKLAIVFADYLDKRQKINLAVSGEDLRKWGVPPGPIYKEALNYLKETCLAGGGVEPSSQKSLVQSFLKSKGVEINVF